MQRPHRRVEIRIKTDGCVAASSLRCVLVDQVLQGLQFDVVEIVDPLIEVDLLGHEAVRDALGVSQLGRNIPHDHRDCHASLSLETATTSRSPPNRSVGIVRIVMLTHDEVQRLGVCGLLKVVEESAPPRLSMLIVIGAVGCLINTKNMFS